MNALFYGRVSTKEQTKNLSLSTQRKTCRELCQVKGLAVLEEFVDAGESAKTTDRPAFKRMLEYCRLHKGTVHFVVVYNLSRFSRNAFDFALVQASLRALGISILSATEEVGDTPLGKFTTNLLIAISQLENDSKSERTKAGMRAAIELGRWPFQAPIGYITGGRGQASLLVDADRGHLVRQAFELFATGGFSKREVLRRLTSSGLFTRRGKPLTPQTLDALLRNEVYAGRVLVPSWGLSVPGDFEPIVAEPVFKSVQNLLNGRRRQIIPYERNHPDFPLRRFISCSGCDTPLTGSWSTGRGRRYAYYSCRCANCRRVKIPKDALETKFVELLNQLQPETAYVRLFKAVVLDVWRQRQREGHGRRAALAAKLPDLRAKLDRVEDSFIHERRIDQRTFEGQRDKLRQEIGLLELEIQSITDSPDVEGVVEFAEHVLTNAPQVWSEAGLAQKQCLQKVMFPSGLAFDGQEFGTAVTCLAFKKLDGNGGSNSGMASPTGHAPSLRDDRRIVIPAA